ncbi:glycosyltransferase [Marinilabilia sp.]|uniref:glycosyltransferase family 2 protein n=1 Tax=Marinilabilia sp. TaxID=2021252 RepID=UPI0025B82026|nr:glycosyltransferase [Marinilabilia sp.]
MISICIPVFNFDVRQLVNTLSRQVERAEFPCEIVLIDDGSDEEYKKINRSVCNREVYVELPDNVGRAKIRNLFLEYTKYRNLLFLDCDSIVITDTFLQKYASAVASSEVNVVCGGRVYDSFKPTREYLLRWKYGIQKESRSCEERRKTPNRSFMSNNFLIRREILAEFPFDERIIRYGHEDTLLGFVLKKNQINITHIDNPVMNGELEINSEYLRKSATSVKNLGTILEYVDYDPDFVNDIGLLRFYIRIKPVAPVVLVLFNLFRPTVEFLLKNGWIALWLFDFFKLGLFLKSDFKKELL